MKIWENNETIIANDINLILQKLPVQTLFYEATKLTQQEQIQQTQFLNNLFPLVDTANIDGKGAADYKVDNQFKYFFYKINTTLEEILNNISQQKETCLIINYSVPLLNYQDNPTINYAFNSNFISYGIESEHSEFILYTQEEFLNCNLYIMALSDIEEKEDLSTIQIQYNQLRMRAKNINSQIYFCINNPNFIG